MPSGSGLEWVLNKCLLNLVGPESLRVLLSVDLRKRVLTEPGSPRAPVGSKGFCRTNFLHAQALAFGVHNGGYSVSQDRVLHVHLKGQVLAEVERKVWALCALSLQAPTGWEIAHSVHNLVWVENMSKSNTSNNHGAEELSDFLESVSSCSVGAGLYYYIL